MLSVYSVLIGDKYSSSYVYRLRQMVDKNLRSRHEVFCITDRELTGVNTIEPIKHGDTPLPGWWQKLALFKPGLATGRSLFLDLDVVIVGELDGVVSAFGHAELAAPRDWSQGTLASPFMLWRGGTGHEIWERFTPEVMVRHHGDQNFIDEVMAKKWTEIPPPTICSYKWHCRGQGGPPPGARVVCFHGKPDPHEVEPQEPWITEAWV